MYRQYREIIGHTIMILQTFSQVNNITCTIYRKILQWHSVGLDAQGHNNTEIVD